MLKRIGFLVALLISLSIPVSVWGQGDALNLPADLFVLLNNGLIQRYGVGAEGVTNLTPEGLFIVDFGVDSLGERIAFRTESGIFAINVASGGDPQQLEGPTADVPPYRGMGDTIAWSPNGDALAYTTTYGARAYFNTGAVPAFVDLREGVFKALSWSPGGRFLTAEADQNIWWVYRREGFNLVLTSAIPSSIGTAWVSDSELIFAPADGGLRLMNLDQANAQAVLLDESLTYRLPFLNAQDALVFFGRDPNDENVPDGYGRLLQLQRGAQQLETIGQVPIALAGLRWTPGGSLLAAFQGGLIALYDPSTGLGFPLPIENIVAYAWGPVSHAPPVQIAAPTEIQTTAVVETAIPEVIATSEPTPLPVSAVTALTLSADSFFLAPDTNGIVQVWKMRAGGTPPQPFTQSGSDVAEFTASPDGNHVAYVVDAELWLQTGTEQPKLLARLNSFAPAEADFSMDNTQLAYVDERSGIWVVALADNAPQLVRANGDKTYRRPQFAPDGLRLLLDVYGSAGTSIGVLDLTTRDLIESLPMTDSLALNTRWLRDGQIYTYSDAITSSSGDTGFYIINSASLGAQPTQWIPTASNITVRAAVEAVDQTLRVVLADGTEAFAPLHVIDFDLTGATQTPILDIGSVIAPSVSPDGRFVGGYESLTEIDGIQQGAITVVDLLNGRRFVLSSPAAAWGFRWSVP